jgi:uncharacterized membrane protein
MNKQQATVVGVVLSIVGIILLIYAIVSYTGIQERVGWYLDMFPSSTRYNQEMMTYGAVGVIGVVLLVAGLLIVPISSRNKK